MDRPRATVGAIMVKEGKVLLQLRNHRPFEGRWGFPGGHIEKGETAKEAVIREIKEETGLELKPEFFCYSDEICPEEGWHALAIMFTGAAGGKERPDPKEVKELRWVPLEEAAGMGLAFRHSRVLESYMAFLNKARMLKSVGGGKKHA